MAKIHPADARLDARMQWVTSFQEGKNRIWDGIFLLLAFFLILSFGLLIFLLPKEDFSESENRMLAEFPALESEKILSGKFSGEVASFYSDRFPLRSLFLKTKAGCELFLGKGENNGILYGADGYLIDRMEYGENELRMTQENLDAIADFTEICLEKELSLFLSFAPRTVDIAANRLSPLYSGERTGEIWKLYEHSGLSYLDFRGDLIAADRAGKQVMYRTDHHWTTAGAYLAYSALAEQLGLVPYALSAFQTEAVTDDFRGTSDSRGQFPWVKNETIELYRYSGDEDYRILIRDTGKEAEGLYDRSALTAKDKYAVFLGGNYGHVSIYSENETGEPEEKPTLLLVKDSFALSVLPFLLRHYHVELIDLRYYTGSLCRALFEEGGTLSHIDEGLFLVGVDTLATTTAMKKLLYGVK